MEKPTIAVDMDDVLAANAEGFVAYCNERWGTNLTAEDYSEDWALMLEVDTQEARRRSDEYHTSGAVKDYKHHPDAIEVLKSLKRHYTLKIVTSRRSLIVEETKEWLDLYFKGFFDDVVFAGLYDEGQHHHKTKTESLLTIGASFLIDDQPKHCFAAAEVGIQAILFGDYSWNRNAQLQNGVTRCANWEAVMAYFDGQV